MFGTLETRGPVPQTRNRNFRVGGTDGGRGCWAPHTPSPHRASRGAQLLPPVARPKGRHPPTCGVLHRPPGRVACGRPGRGGLPQGWAKCGTRVERAPGARVTEAGRGKENRWRLHGNACRPLSGRRQKRIHTRIWVCTCMTARTGNPWSLGSAPALTQSPRSPREVPSDRSSRGAVLATERPLWVAPGCGLPPGRPSRAAEGALPAPPPFLQTGGSGTQRMGDHARTRGPRKVPELCSLASSQVGKRIYAPGVTHVPARGTPRLTRASPPAVRPCPSPRPSKAGECA